MASILASAQPPQSTSQLIIGEIILVILFVLVVFIILKIIHHYRKQKISSNFQSHQNRQNILVLALRLIGIAAISVGIPALNFLNVLIPRSGSINGSLVRGQTAAIFWTLICLMGIFLFYRMIKYGGALNRVIPIRHNIAIAVGSLYLSLLVIGNVHDWMLVKKVTNSQEHVIFILWLGLGIIYLMLVGWVMANSSKYVSSDRATAHTASVK